MLRAWQQTCTAPHAPVYVCLDAGLQEQKLAESVHIPDPARFKPAPPGRADADAIRKAAEALTRAKKPVMLCGRGRRTPEHFKRRVELAELLGAGMLSDLKSGSMVPTDHPLHIGQPFNNLTKTAIAALREADMILSLD